MQWFTIDFNKHVDFNTCKEISLKNEMILLMKCVFAPLKKLQEESLYRMQHDGTTISLEKVLNDYFTVDGYDATDHDATKTVYIEDAPIEDVLYIFQDDEIETSFLEDDGDDNEDDVFLDNDSEGVALFKFKIFIPDTYIFTEAKLRAVIDSFRYIGTKYTIETYTL